MRFLKQVTTILLVISLLFLAGNRVTAIECLVEGVSCPKELHQEAGTLKYSSFFFTDFKKKLLENQSGGSIYILESLTKKFPGTLILQFKQEHIEYLLESSEQKNYIGKSGVVLPQQPNDLEITTFNWRDEKQILTQNMVDEGYHSLFLSIARSLQKLTTKNHKISWISDSEIILEIPGEPLYIFDRETIETQVKKVGTIIHARELDEIEESILEIDMRFDLPVLRISQ